MSPDLGRRDCMVAMYDRGLGTGEIAREFSVQAPAVRRTLIRAGVYRGAVRRGPKRSPKTVAQIASLTEHVAEGGSINGWATANSLNQSWASQLWDKIKRDLGAQAV